MFNVVRNQLFDMDCPENELNRAKQQLQNMTDVSFPFSVFWKWHILSDTFLSAVFEIN